MPNRCSVINCRGNCDKETKCRVFRLPKDENERKTWLNVIPSGSFPPNLENLHICEGHWPKDALLKRTRGGSTRPTVPPSIFNVPSSCLPTPKPVSRADKVEFANQEFFDKKDKFNSFSEFRPQKELKKRYDRWLYDLCDDEHVFAFMTQKYRESWLVITVTNKKVLCSPVVFCAYKRGIEVTIPKGILNPNNGMNRYSHAFL